MEQQLIHAALLKEAQESEYTSLELANIRLQSENVMINYFLDRETRRLLDNLNVEEDVLKKIYEDNKANFRLEPQVKLDTIFMTDTEKAQELLEKVTEENFAKMKEENDVREDKKPMDEFVPLSSLLPQIVNAIAKAEKGIIKSLVFVDGGCHIIYLKDKKDEREPSYDEAKDFVKAEFKKSIYNDVYNKVVEGILNKRHGVRVKQETSEEAKPEVEKKDK